MRKLTLLARRYACTQSYMRIDSAPEEYLRTAGAESLGHRLQAWASQGGARNVAGKVDGGRPHVPALYFRPNRPVTAQREK